MARHQFSADALWLGLTNPEHQAWAVGAAALMNIMVPGLVDARGVPANRDRRPSGRGTLQGETEPLAEPRNAHPRSADAVDLDVALGQLRALGSQADRARTATEKQRVFAELVARCGSCHAALGLDFSSSGLLSAADVASRAKKRVVISADKIVITEKIQFDFDAATIKHESHSLLDELAALIRAQSQLRKISIEGHTDSDGDAAYNIKLSRERAAAVRRYLMEHGVDPSRLTSTGYGTQHPLASNDTEEGKEANRRVEFVIVEQAPVQQTYEVDPNTNKSRLFERSGE